MVFDIPQNDINKKSAVFRHNFGDVIMIYDDQPTSSYLGNLLGKPDLRTLLAHDACQGTWEACCKTRQLETLLEGNLTWTIYFGTVLDNRAFLGTWPGNMFALEPCLGTCLLQNPSALEIVAGNPAKLAREHGFNPFAPEPLESWGYLKAVLGNLAWEPSRGTLAEHCLELLSAVCTHYHHFPFLLLGYVHMNK